MVHNGLNRFINHHSISSATDQQADHQSILLAEWPPGINSPEETLITLKASSAIRQAHGPEHEATPAFAGRTCAG
jgi:hypothetical protein